MSRIVREPIDLAGVVADVAHPGAGAVATFSGIVRNEHRGREVIGIDYHAYEDMAVRELDRIETEIRERWPQARASIVHRIGELAVGDASVVIAVASPHRPEAFAACRHAIDRIKECVPIWKKEKYPDGHAWIEGS